MIPSTLRLTLSIAVICYFIIILFYLKRKRLELKYTLIWILAGLIMGVMIFFPGLLIWFVRTMGVESDMNGFFVLCFAFIIAILMMLTSIVSRQTMKIKILIQEMSIMDKRIRELEERYGLTKTEEEFSEQSEADAQN